MDKSPMNDYMFQWGGLAGSNLTGKRLEESDLSVSCRILLPASWSAVSLDRSISRWVAGAVLTVVVRQARPLTVRDSIIRLGVSHSNNGRCRRLRLRPLLSSSDVSRDSSSRRHLLLGEDRLAAMLKVFKHTRAKKCSAFYHLSAPPQPISVLSSLSSSWLAP